MSPSTFGNDSFRWCGHGSPCIRPESLRRKSLLTQMAGVADIQNDHQLGDGL